MSAPPKVSTQAIVNALLLWRGDVSAVARLLGLSRNGLYQRCKSLGLDLEGFRNAGRGNPVIPINVDTTLPTMPTASRLPGTPARAHAVLKSGRANFRGADERRRLGHMQQGATTAEVDEVPIKTSPARRLPPLKLRPDLREALQRAAWQLQAHFQVATDENLILEQLVEESLAPFVQSKLEPVAAPARRKKAEKNGGGSGAE